MRPVLRSSKRRTEMMPRSISMSGHGFSSPTQPSQGHGRATRGGWPQSPGAVSPCGTCAHPERRFGLSNLSLIIDLDR
jgi:hypothetical protein